ncbi:MAG: fibronectin type III domain-containing protein [Bacteroidaceae bacterium]|nr:fibronectin type III domain-containing protein [Bacteroidaceae bacterium]
MMKTIKIILTAALACLFTACEHLDTLRRNTIDSATGQISYNYDSHQVDAWHTFATMNLYYGSGVVISKSSSFTQGSYRKIYFTSEFNHECTIDDLEPNTTYYYKIIQTDHFGEELMTTNYGQFKTMKRPEECITISPELNFFVGGVQIFPNIAVNDQGWENRIWEFKNGREDLKVKAYCQFDTGRAVERENTSFDYGNPSGIDYYYEDEADKYARATVYVELYAPNPLYDGLKNREQWMLLCTSETVSGTNSYWR